MARFIYSVSRTVPSVLPPYTSVADGHRQSEAQRYTLMEAFTVQVEPAPSVKLELLTPVCIILESRLL